jgi:DNA-binding CsgD family transcriptional regulator
LEQLELPLDADAARTFVPRSGSTLFIEVRGAVGERLCSPAKVSTVEADGWPTAPVGRAAECAALDHLLSSVRDGLSGVLVARGEPGIGKTALLDWAADQAADMRVARVFGVESEVDLGFAALHQLLLPFLGSLDGLPTRQAEAMGSAFGLMAGAPPDRFLVGLATLTLLSEAAHERPVLCLIDDAQWLDRVSIEVLAFAARRLYADQVGMVFALREWEERGEALHGLPDLAVGGLGADAAQDLLAMTVAGAVDRRVAERIVAETGGNPLALVEFAHELSADELSGASPLPEPLRFGGRVEELYLARVRALPPDAQTLLLLAAADPVGEPSRIWGAAERLGVDPTGADIPEQEGILTWMPAVRFRHPLMRSAAYYGASTAARRRAHGALAAATDPDADPDRRAWHMAEAASSPDEDVAVALERSAVRARSRGGWASRAAFLERSAELTQDEGTRAERLLGAAEARLAAGEPHVAQMLVERAAPGISDPFARGRARRLEGHILYAAGELAKAPAVLLDAARMIEPHEPRLARDTLLEAIERARLSGRFGAGVAEVLRAARASARSEEPSPTVADLLLDGFTALAERDDAGGAASLRAALAALPRDRRLPDDALEHLMAVCMGAFVMYDDGAWHDLTERCLADARGRGAVADTLMALLGLAYSELNEGRIGDADATISEGRALAVATDHRAHVGSFVCAELTTLAWRGRERDVRPLAAELLRDVGEPGGFGARRIHHALAILELGLGRYEPALRHALETFDEEAELVFQSDPEVVEAAARCGERATALRSLDDLSRRAAACRTDWALGVLARSRALLADGDRAEADYQLAIEHLQRCRVVPQLARAHLVYGEWLRRQRRRREARDELRSASQLFDACGMEAFASRARAELLTAGEHAPRPSVEPEDVLTPQEAQVARLAGAGATNQEIAARLFISVNTVDYHLRKVYRKLGVSSRVRLAGALNPPPGVSTGH